MLLLREVREEKPERQNGLNCLSRKCLRLGPQREGSSREPGGRERGADPVTLSLGVVLGRRRSRTRDPILRRWPWGSHRP